MDAMRRGANGLWGLARDCGVGLVVARGISFLLLVWGCSWILGLWVRNGGGKYESLDARTRLGVFDVLCRQTNSL